LRLLFRKDLKMVSVIIINYNTYELTKTCIASIYKNYQKKIEIIVIDNASTEKDVALLNDVFPDLKIIKNKENLGFAKANNIGIQIAVGDYILLLNSDAELKNDAISICIEALNEKNNVGIVTGQLIFPNGIIQHNCQSFPSVKNEIIELFRLQKLMGKEKTSQLFKGAFFDHNKSCYTDWVWGTFFLFKKEDLKKLNLKHLSDDFFMYGEDLEWCYQFNIVGLKTYYCKDAQIIHHLGSSKFGDFYKTQKQIIKNELLFIKKYEGNLTLLSIRVLKFIKFTLLSIKTPNYFKIGRYYLQKI